MRNKLELNVSRTELYYNLMGQIKVQTQHEHPIQIYGEQIEQVIHNID